MIFRHLLFGLLLGSASACAPGPDPADLALLGGKIVTMDAAVPEARALAARGGLVVAVGSDEDIARYIGASTEVIRLDGLLAVPGLIESHGHLRNLGRLRMNLDLTTARTWRDIVERVREAARDIPPGEWIVGRGWHQERFESPPEPSLHGYPTHADLDRFAGGHPVLLEHASGHMAVANTLALSAAGIDGASPDPAGGEIVRDAEGHLTGLLRDNAVDLVSGAHERHLARRSPEETEADARREIETAIVECLRKGITTFQDAGSSFATIDLMRQMAREGRLGLRVWAMIGEDNAALRDHLSDYRIVGESGGFLTVRAIKRSVDGALGAHTAWLLEPYDDDPTARGLNTQPVEEIEQTARLALEHGFQLCVHAIGDRANRETLDLFERTIGGAGAVRWRIEHAQHLHPADVPRFAQLGVVASVQGIHCASDGPWVIERIGAKRAEEGAYVWRKLLDSGAVLINGTDTPVEDVDPIANFHASITRKTASGAAFYPAQRMTREEALRSYTSSAAWAAFEENVKGSLSPGKLADVTVLSRDILTIPEDEIPGTRVVFTIVEGKVAYRARAERSRVD